MCQQWQLSQLIVLADTQGLDEKALCQAHTNNQHQFFFQLSEADADLLIRKLEGGTTGEIQRHSRKH